jgi:hypothetical protein
MTSQAPAEIPQLFAEKFARAFAEFVGAVRDAVAAAILDPAFSSSSALLMWQTEALPRLEQENATIQNGMARFLVGETRTIATLAAEERHLAKKLDGFPLDFAGVDRAKLLDRLETAVVISASQICQAAGIP